MLWRKGTDMAFGLLKWHDDGSEESPGSIGGKIKRYRELRKWSQRALGLKCGFSDSTADVRIAQYEKNKKAPREKQLKELAAGLGINECALFDADLLSKDRMCHALFDIEDFHGLHPVKIGDRYYLEFSGPTWLHPEGYTRLAYYGFLERWYQMRQKYTPNDTDSEDEKREKAAEYTLWRAEYPDNVAKEDTEQLQDMMKMDRLQAEMDALNAKMQSEKELARIDTALEAVMPKVHKTYKPIQKESDLIYLIKDMIEKGVAVERFSPEIPSDADHKYIHLLSIKTEEILGDENKKKLYAGLVCALDTLRNLGFDISKRITSKNKELFVTYCYASEDYEYFEGVDKHWDEMMYIIERKDAWSEQELAELETNFKSAVTGEGDMDYTIRSDTSAD